jgi:hypothetical protein
MLACLKPRCACCSPLPNRGTLWAVAPLARAYRNRTCQIGKPANCPPWASAYSADRCRVTRRFTNSPKDWWLAPTQKKGKTNVWWTDCLQPMLPVHDSDGTMRGLPRPTRLTGDWLRPWHGRWRQPYLPQPMAQHHWAKWSWVDSAHHFGHMVWPKGWARGVRWTYHQPIR